MIQLRHANDIDSDHDRLWMDCPISRPPGYTIDLTIFARLLGLLRLHDIQHLASGFFPSKSKHRRSCNEHYTLRHGRDGCCGLTTIAERSW